MPLPSPVTFRLAVDDLIRADHLGLDLDARCAGCGAPTGRRMLCPVCADELKRADMAEHAHTLACYEPDAALAELCADCRAVVDPT